MRTIAVLLLITFTFGCASAPPNMDATKPVEFTNTLWAPSMRQEGVVINEITAMDTLANIQDASGPAKSAKLLFWSSAASAFVGGWFLGAGLAGKDNQGQKLGVSAGFIGLSFLLAFFQKNSLGEAVEIYNSKLKPKKKSNFHFEPTMAPVVGGAVGGFNVYF